MEGHGKLRKDNEDLKKIKQIELEMLDLFIQVCEKLNLQYFLLGGTLLGAVRHKGFIPWDDDIDVGMPRQDYEVFISKAQKLLPEKFFVQTYKTDPEWVAHFCKLRNSETTFIESSVKNRKINHGVFIDIFSLDYCSNSPFSKLKNLLLKSIETKEFNQEKSKKGKLLNVIATVITFNMSPKTAFQKREKLLMAKHNGSYLANYSGAWGDKEIVPAEWYGSGAALEFEGRKVIGPKEYNKWLTQVYGDYMQLPPIEKQVTHHYTEIIDLQKSYKQYLKDNV